MRGHWILAVVCFLVIVPDGEAGSPVRYGTFDVDAGEYDKGTFDFKTGEKIPDLGETKRLDHDGQWKPVALQKMESTGLGTEKQYRLKTDLAPFEWLVMVGSLRD
jgi:hypothetical protein